MLYRQTRNMIANASTVIFPSMISAITASITAVAVIGDYSVHTRKCTIILGSFLMILANITGRKEREDDPDARD
jgi:hypothetical protein